MGTVLAVCSGRDSRKKRNIHQATVLAGFGISGDSNSNSGPYQLLILPEERREELRNKGKALEYGDCGENLVVSGEKYWGLPIGTKFLCGDLMLEMTGKTENGFFCKVLWGGILTEGDYFGVD